MNAPHQPPGKPGDSHLRWFLRGMLGIFSVPALILMSAFVGFAGLALESGIPFAQTVFMTATIWALPSQIVIVGAIASGTGLLGATIGVVLASIRLTPMLVSWVPVVRDERTPRWQLLLLSHFVAITSWVFAMSYLPAVERRYRVVYFAGFACTLTTCNIGVTAIAYSIAAELPAMAAGALFMLTPTYFFFSLWKAAQNRCDVAALATGLVMGPIVYSIAPNMAVLITGLGGGTAVYLIERFFRERSAPNPAMKGSDDGE